MKPRISIAMATYNGEKYLQPQLESLARQTYSPCELVVGDDGSKDGTIGLLEEFSRTARFPVSIIRNSENLGYADNFLQTASRCVGDWIAFCDQDDVWLPTKLEQSASAIRSDANLHLVLQNAVLCDDNLVRRGRLLPNSIDPGMYECSQVHALWAWNGFLQTVKSCLIRDIQFTDRPIDYPLRGRSVLSHDYWTCMLANALGGICVIKEPAALHRRHPNAITGSHEERTIGEILCDALQNGLRECHIRNERATSAARVLRKLAKETRNKDWAVKFARSASLFDRYSAIQSRRTQLWTNDITGRLRSYLSLWLIGGYLGQHFVAMGWRTALKDAAVALVGSKHQRESRNVTPTA